MKTASIITIGDELLYGAVVDTNAAYIGQCLSDLGIEPIWSITVGDSREQIHQALEIASQQADVVLITGGLGPTHDDVTKTIIAEATGLELVFHQEILDQVEVMFAQRGVSMPESNRIQALIPEGADILKNPIGTAPGFSIKHDQASIFVMPGVPREMKKMMGEQVIPRLQVHTKNRVIVHRWIRTTGIGESNLSELIKDIIAEATEIKIASLPQNTGTNLRLTAQAGTVEEARRQINMVESRLLNRAGSYIYGTDEDTLEDVVGRLLTKTGATLALAESCTGGLVIDRLTDVPGSSVYICQGVVAYSNEAKIQHLNVSEEILARHGAVSSETAAAMASGIRRISGATYGLSTTGIAGPGGATALKPVGLVYLGLAHADGTITQELRLGTDRRTNKTRAMLAALNMLRLFILEPQLIA